MTLQQLRYIIEVAKCGSINEAAKNLYISQPSMSKAIKELENEIGITIFNRTNKGIIISNEGQEFLGYARQVIEQQSLLEEKYLAKKDHKQKFSVSCQHYSFCVNAFVDIIKEHGYNQYDFSLQECRTSEIIENVKNLTSEIGVLYLNDFNEKIITKILNESHLDFVTLFEAKPHIFISKDSPLASCSSVVLEELKDYPFLKFDQGNNNSFYFSEEILSTYSHKKTITVNDRATLFNMVIGLNGFTISSGVISKTLNPHIISIPLDVKDHMTIGYIHLHDIPLSSLAKEYIRSLIKNADTLV